MVDFITKSGKVIPIKKRMGLSSKDLRWKKSQRSEAKKQLVEADRRFQIAVGKMSEIKNRVDELEVERNQTMRKEFLENKVKTNPDKRLIKELEGLKIVNKKAPETYHEVQYGYRSMSHRKNDLEEERNSIVKFIEDRDKEIKKDAELKKELIGNATNS